VCSRCAAFRGRIPFALSFVSPNDRTQNMKEPSEVRKLPLCPGCLTAARKETNTYNHQSPFITVSYYSQGIMLF